jgi:GT2 family glycosyltransferase
MLSCKKFKPAAIMSVENFDINSVTVVTVTYGDRWHMLSKLLRFTESASLIGDVVLIENGGVNSVSTQVENEVFRKVFVSSLSKNLGSACGFKLGIKAALKRKAEYIWLLDDDNLPQETSLEVLVAAYKRIRKNFPSDQFALLSFRPDHQADIAAGVPLHRCYPRPGSFLGFHLIDIPYKIWRRTPWGKPRPSKALPDFILVPAASYSGLFCHRSVIEQIGLPNDEMVLYADDTEFTSRLTRSGGKIFLIPHSRIFDMETSWNIKTRFSFSFVGWLCHSSDLRAFYAARNHAYIEAKNDKHKLMHAVNRGIYLTLMTIFALINRRVARLRLLFDAIRRGESGVLGVDKRYPLL